MTRYDIEKIIKEGGATLTADGAPVTFPRGYQVSKKDCYCLTVGNVRAIVRAVNKVLKELKPGDFCGIWIDGEGFAYIDISEHIARKRDALRLGRERHQKSIYEWRTGKAPECHPGG